MNTPAHLILGLAAFGKPGRPKITAAALGGALLPDLSLYLLAGGALGLGIPAERVFGELYYSPTWQTVFAIDNSFILWTCALAVAVWARSAWGIAAAGAGILHLALDLPLHHDDGRPHFWPLSDWVYESPLSYWDPAHHGGVIGAVEAALVVGLAIWLWRKFQRWPMRVVIALLVVMEMSVGGVWAFVFG